jgi:hypothetical protein
MMATADGTLQERLYAGAQCFMAVHDGPASPPELKAQFASVKEGLMVVLAQSLHAVTSSLSEDDASELIGRVCDLCESVQLNLKD